MHITYDITISREAFNNYLFTFGYLGNVRHRQNAACVSLSFNSSQCQISVRRLTPEPAETGGKLGRSEKSVSQPLGVGKPGSKGLAPTGQASFSKKLYSNEINYLRAVDKDQLRRGVIFSDKTVTALHRG